MEMSETDLGAIRVVIEEQIQAFLQDDAITAFAQAAPGIQMQFGTAENFVRMVEAAYPPVYRPRSVVFEGMMQVDGFPAQQVMMLDQAGDLIRATYMMQPQPYGRWKIAGCYLTPLEEG